MTDANPQQTSSAGGICKPDKQSFLLLEKIESQPDQPSGWLFLFIPTHTASQLNSQLPTIHNPATSLLITRAAICIFFVPSWFRVSSAPSSFFWFTRRHEGLKADGKDANGARSVSDGKTAYRAGSVSDGNDLAYFITYRCLIPGSPISRLAFITRPIRRLACPGKMRNTQTRVPPSAVGGL